PPDELSPITTVRPPLLLLPAREAGRTEGDLLDHFLRYFIPHPTAADAGVVREARFQFLVCRAVGNTPWADALIVFLHAINGASVDEATCLAATDAFGVGLDDHSGRHGVRVVFEGWQRHVISQSS